MLDKVNRLTESHGSLRPWPRPGLWRVGAGRRHRAVQHPLHLEQQGVNNAGAPPRPSSTHHNGDNP